MNLSVKEMGKGFPLLILHGLFGSGDNWLSIGKRFSQYFHVFLIDQRNHGNSEHSDEMDYEVMANDVYEFCQDNNLESVCLIGHSMGGKTAMMFSALYSNIVKKLCIIDIAPKIYPSHHTYIIDSLKKLDLMNTRSQLDESLSQSIENKGTRQFLLKNLAREQNGFSWKVNIRGIEDNYSYLRSFPDILPVQCETLFIAGEESDYITENDEELIYDLFFNSDIVYVEGAGHWVHAEKPIETINLLENFLVG